MDREQIRSGKRRQRVLDRMPEAISEEDLLSEDEEVSFDEERRRRAPKRTAVEPANVASISDTGDLSQVDYLNLPEPEIVDPRAMSNRDRRLAQVAAAAEGQRYRDILEPKEGFEEQYDATTKFQEEEYGGGSIRREMELDEIRGEVDPETGVREAALGEDAAEYDTQYAKLQKENPNMSETELQDAAIKAVRSLQAKDAEFAAKDFKTVDYGEEMENEVRRKRLEAEAAAKEEQGKVARDAAKRVRDRGQGSKEDRPTIRDAAKTAYDKVTSLDEYNEAFPESPDSYDEAPPMEETPTEGTIPSFDSWDEYKEVFNVRGESPDEVIIGGDTFHWNEEDGRWEEGPAPVADPSPTEDSEPSTVTDTASPSHIIDSYSPQKQEALTQQPGGEQLFGSLNALKNAAEEGNRKALPLFIRSFGAGNTPNETRRLRRKLLRGLPPELRESIGASLKKAVLNTEPALQRDVSELIQRDLYTSMASKGVPTAEDEKAIQDTAEKLKDVFLQHSKIVGTGSMTGGITRSLGLDEEGEAKRRKLVFALGEEIRGPSWRTSLQQPGSFPEGSLIEEIVQSASAHRFMASPKTLFSGDMRQEVLAFKDANDLLVELGIVDIDTTPEIPIAEGSSGEPLKAQRSEGTSPQVPSPVEEHIADAVQEF